MEPLNADIIAVDGNMESKDFFHRVSKCLSAVDSRIASTVSGFAFLISSCENVKNSNLDDIASDMNVHEFGGRLSSEMSAINVLIPSEHFICDLARVGSTSCRHVRALHSHDVRPEGDNTENELSSTVDFEDHNEFLRAALAMSCRKFSDVQVVYRSILSAILIVFVVET